MLVLKSQNFPLPRKNCTCKLLFSRCFAHTSHVSTYESEARSKDLDESERKKNLSEHASRQIDSPEKNKRASIVLSEFHLWRLRVLSKWLSMDTGWNKNARSPFFAFCFLLFHFRDRSTIDGFSRVNTYSFSQLLFESCRVKSCQVNVSHF